MLVRKPFEGYRLTTADTRIGLRPGGTELEGHLVPLSAFARDPRLGDALGRLGLRPLFYDPQTLALVCVRGQPWR